MQEGKRLGSYPLHSRWRASISTTETDALGCWGTLAFLNRHGMSGSKVVLVRV